MYFVINKCVTAVKISNFSGHYLRNRSTLDIGVLGYIGIVQHKERSPEVLSIPPGTPCIHVGPITHRSRCHMILYSGDEGFQYTLRRRLPGLRLYRGLSQAFRINSVVVPQSAAFLHVSFPPYVTHIGPFNGTLNRASDSVVQ